MGESPIGVFDSGIGGLTVLKELLAHLPGESFVYFGDTARVPYGTKSGDTVRRFSRENVRLLLDRGVNRRCAWQERVELRKRVTRISACELLGCPHLKRPLFDGAQSGVIVLHVNDHPIVDVFHFDLGDTRPSAMSVLGPFLRKR